MPRQRVTRRTAPGGASGSRRPGRKRAFRPAISHLPSPAVIRWKRVKAKKCSTNEITINTSASTALPPVTILRPRWHGSARKPRRWSTSRHSGRESSGNGSARCVPTSWTPRAERRTTASWLGPSRRSLSPRRAPHRRCTLQPAMMVAGRDCLQVSAAPSSPWLPALPSRSTLRRRNTPRPPSGIARCTSGACPR